MSWVWFPEGQEGIVAQLRRGTLTKIDDSGSQQIIKNLTGMKTESFEDVYRPQPHGFTSHPPKDSEGVFLSLGGRSDRLLFLGGEHKDKRIKDLPEGGACLYDADGNIVRVVKDDMQIKHEKKIVQAVGGDNGPSITTTADSIILKVGGSAIEIKDGSILVKSGRVDLGDVGGQAVDRTDDNPSSKVFAV